MFVIWCHKFIWHCFHCSLVPAVGECPFCVSSSQTCLCNALEEDPMTSWTLRTIFFLYSSFQNLDASLPVSILPSSRFKERKKKLCYDRPTINSIVSRPNDKHSRFWLSSLYEVSSSIYIANKKTRSLHNLMAKIQSVWEDLPLSIASTDENLVVNISVDAVFLVHDCSCAMCFRIILCKM